MIRNSQLQIGTEEIQAVLEVMNSGHIAQGKRVQAFEQAFALMCGMNYAVATSSGTTALHTALLAHGIGAGDEVITTPFSFIASANSILYTGARPVFVDINPHTFNIDPGQIESAITRRTRAILPVHLFGLSCDMKSIQDIAQRHNLIIIEDACQSHGATFQGYKVGSFGTGVFSLYATKNITCAEGGMITTNDRLFAERCRSIRQHGMQGRYQHAELGFNYRMSDIHAAIGVEQLKKLPRFNQIRQRNAQYLNAHLKGVVTPCAPKDCEHVYHQYTVRVADGRRDALQTHLADQGIVSQIFYPVPIHQQQLYQERLSLNLCLPQAEQTAKEVLSLPIHPGLGQADLDMICNAVNQFFEGSAT